MFCKKCGSPLPSQGFICLNCGFMMDKEQIELQKEFKASSKNEFKVELVSEKYGNKKKIFQKRDEVSFKYKGVFLFSFLFLLLLFILIVVYFA